MITALNSMSKDELKRGQNVYIGTVGVPDLWVYSVETSSVNYSYTNDETIVNSLGTDTTIQVGYYKLAQLETQKVDIGDINYSISGLQSDVGTINTNVGTLQSDVTKLTDRVNIYGKSITDLKDYSVVENQVGSFLGYKLYRKMYQISSVNSGATTIDSNMTVNNVRFISKVYGCYISVGSLMPLSYNSQLSVYIHANNGLTISSNVNATDLKVLVEYVKK